jgi:hypothetical protein
MPRSPNLASSQLDHLLTTSSAYSGAGLALRLIARAVAAAAARAPDVAIASILRNQPARARQIRHRRRFLDTRLLKAILTRQVLRPDPTCRRGG